MNTATQVDAEQELASLCGVLNASYARLVTICLLYTSPSPRDS